MEKIKMFLVATNIVARRPPERLPTGTLTTRAKIMVASIHSNGSTTLPSACAKKIDT